MTTGTASPVDVLSKAKTIAVVGASRDVGKEAHMVPRYLKHEGYRIVPVNPTAVEIMAEKAYPSLLDIPEAVAKSIDVVEVFRPSEELPAVAQQVVELRRRYARPIVFWSQAGLESDEAKRTLELGGVPYVMDACMRTVHQLYIRRTA
jgi:uncharacterized protein